MRRTDVVGWLHASLTEERTDRALDLLFASKHVKRLPWWIPQGVARAVLDALLPGGVLFLVDAVLPSTDGGAE